MVHVPIDALADPSGWVARHSDGSASDRITTTAVTGPAHLAGAAVRFAVDAGASGDRVERALVGVPRDLRGVDDLQVWVRADRAAALAGGFLLELSLGSAALGLDAVANTWRRLLPVEDPHRWQPVLFALADLPAPIRQGVSQIRLEVVADDSGRVELAALAGMRQELLGDVERALVTRLDKAVKLGNTAVPAVVAPDQPPGQPNQPHLRIRPVAVRPAPERASFGETRTDYTSAGFSLRRMPEPVDLDYALDAVADNRADQRALVEMIVSRVPATGDVLVVSDRPLPLDWRGPLAQDGDPPVPSAPVRVASARTAIVPPTSAVPPFNELRVEVDSDA